MNGWAQSSGGDVCHSLAPQLISNRYGSVTRCQSQNVNVTPVTLAGQNVQESSATQATDLVTFPDGSKLLLYLSKQPNGAWLISNVVKQLPRRYAAGRAGVARRQAYLGGQPAL